MYGEKNAQRRKMKFSPLLHSQTKRHQHDKSRPQSPIRTLKGCNFSIFDTKSVCSLAVCATRTTLISDFPHDVLMSAS